MVLACGGTELTDPRILNDRVDFLHTTTASQSSATYAYVAPFVVYLLGTAVASEVPDFYPAAYAAVVLAVGVTAWLLLRKRQAVVVHWQVADAVVIGVLGILIWIGLSELALEQRLAGYLPSWLQPQARTGYDPFAELASAWAVWGFIAIRMLGLAILVPLAEELFWRGFLLRWLISPEWEEVPVGKYTAQSCLVVILLFTVAHPEWFAAALYCLLMNGFLYWKKDLWKCMVAHGVSNFVLGAYVLATGTWELW